MDIPDAGGAESASEDESEKALTGAWNSKIHNHSDEEYLVRALSVLDQIVVDNGERQVMGNKDVDMIGW